MSTGRVLLDLWSKNQNSPLDDSFFISTWNKKQHLQTMWAISIWFPLKNIFLEKIAGVFYNVKNGSSFITSKSSSENLSNHNKRLCFCCLQDKTWIKMPKWTIFLISSKVFVLITEIFWQTFWRNKWRSVFDVVKDSNYRFWKEN